MRVATSGKLLCLLSVLSMSIAAFAATPGLPFTEDFSDTNLQDTANTTADWNTAAQQLQLPRARKLYGGLSPATTGLNITSDADYSRSSVFGDVNGDGYVDMVVGVNGSENRLYLHNGTSDPFNGVSGIDIGTDTSNTSDVALGDLDRDGDLDLVVGNRAQDNHIYLNDGNGEPWDTVSPIVFGTSSHTTASITLADFDGDGLLDIAEGNGWSSPAHINHLYLNNGTADPFNGVSGSAITSDAFVTVAAVAADFNEDGAIDIVFGSETNNSLHLYLNNGTTDPFNGVSAQQISSDTNAVYDIAAGDIDGDGDLDLVAAMYGALGSYTERNRFYLNNGTSTPFMSATGADLTTDERNTYSVALGDIDNDGDLDAVFGNNTGASDNITICLNNGTASPFLNATSINLSSDLASTRDIDLVDIDYDGNLDVIATNRTQINRLYLNPGTPNPFEGVSAAAISSDSQATLVSTVADVNHDGYLDYIAGVNSAVSRLYLNNKTSDPFNGVAGTNVGTATDAVQSIATADFNGDGLLDIVQGNSNSAPCRVILNDGSGDPFDLNNWVNVTADTPVTLSVVTGDFDGDGDIDIVAANNGSADRLYRNDGTGTGWTGSNVTADSLASYGVGAGDFNGDGKLDVIIGTNVDATNPVRLYLNDGSGDPFDAAAVSDVYAPGSVEGAAHDVPVGDVDRDGDLDFLLISASATFPSKLFLNNGTSIPFDSVTPIDIANTDEGVVSSRFADADGDGDLDLFTHYFSRTIKLHLNNGTADPWSDDTFEAITDASLPATLGRWISLGDMDNDGDLDAILSMETAIDHVFLSQAADDGGLNPWNAGAVQGSDITADTASSGVVAHGDIDNDGDLDLVFGNQGQVNRSYRNNGTENPWNGVVGDNITSDAENTLGIKLADFNGDGWLDVAVAQSGADKVYFNDGVGDPWDSATQTTFSASGESHAIDVGDMDNDGDIDIVIGRQSATDMVYLNDGDGLSWTERNISQDAYVTKGIAVGDVDGDGDLDVVTTSQVPAEHTRLFLNNGTTNPFNGVSPTDITSDEYDSRTVLLGDIDNDGDLDLIIGNGTSFLSPNRYYANDGDASPFDSAVGVDISSDAHYTTGGSLVDVDGDGDLDFVAANQQATNRVYLNNGTATPWSGVSGIDLSDDVQDSADVSGADFDGDGTVDLAVANIISTENRFYSMSTLYGPNTGSAGSIKVNSLETGIDNVAFNTAATLPPHTALDYWVSNDGGNSWKKSRAGRNVSFAAPGDDLRWRAELRSLSPIYSPSVSEIMLSLNAPTINPSVPNIETEQDTPTAYDLTSHENDSEDSGADLSWSISGVDTGLYNASIDNATNDVLTITPQAGQTGQDTATLTLTDSDGLTDTQDILIIIGSTGPTPPTTFIFPIAPVVNDSLVCAIVFDGTVGAGITPQYEYTWDNGEDPPVVNGPTGLLSNTLPAFHTEAGDVWQCTVRTYDGSTYSSPSIASVTPPILGLGASSLTLTAQPNAITLGQSIALTAKISPSVQGVNVFYDNSVTPVGNTDNKPSTQATNFFGEAIQIFTPDEAGPWSLVAEWLGNADYEGSTASTGVTVNKAQPILSVDLAFESGVAGLPLVLETDAVATVSMDNPNLEAAIPGIFDGLGIQLSVRESIPGQPVGTTILVPSSGTIAADSEGNAVFLRSDFTAAGVDFDTPGSYEIQAKFAGNDDLKTAFSENFGRPDTPTIQVKSGAGYAIICVGRLASGEGVNSHNYTADYVYRSLIDREFDPDDIYYLRQGSSAPGNDNISDIAIDDSTPTEADFQSAIESWAVTKMSASPGPLYVIMIDHGLPGRFFIANTGDETRYIDPIELASSLSILDGNLVGTGAEDEDRIIVYGACNSGSFIPFVSAPGRIIVTASTAVEDSHRGVFDPVINERDGELFTRLLFRNLRKGRRLKESFEQAARKVTEFTFDRSDFSSGSAVQTPLLDDNGDGVGSSFGTLSSVVSPGVDGAVANGITLGISTNSGDSIGWFSATPVITLADDDVLTELDAFSQTPVPANTTAWIAVKPPSFAGAADVDAGDAENEQRSLDLTQRDWNETASNSGTGLFRWSDAVKGGGTLNDLFTAPGAYQVYFYLRDGDTGVVGTHILTTVFRQAESPTPPSAPSLLFPADNSEVGVTWVYGWTEAVDADGDVTYAIQFADPSDTSFTNVLAGRSGIVSTAVQLGADDGIVDNKTYIWRVVAYDKFGASAVSTETHTITIDQTNEGQASLFGFVRGTDGLVIENANVQLSGPIATDYDTQATGVYVFDNLLPGSYGVTVSKSGFESVEQTINLDEGVSSSRNFVLVQDGVRFWGDVSADGNAGTVDASYIIQWRTTDGQGGFLRNTFPSDPGFDPTQAPGTCNFTERLTGACMDFPPYADVDGDGELAIQDAIEILQVKIGQGSNQPYLPADGTDAQPNNHIYDVVKRFSFGGEKGGSRVVSAPNGTAMPSQIVDVPIEIDNADGVESMTIILKYDPDVLTALGAVRGDVTSAWTIFEVDTTSLQDAVIIQGGSVIAASGSGALANVMFEVKAGTQGLVSPLTFTSVSLKPDVVASAASGMLTVTDGSGEPNEHDWYEDGKLNAQDVQTVINLVLGGGNGLGAADVQATINAVLRVN